MQEWGGNQLIKDTPLSERRLYYYEMLESDLIAIKQACALGETEAITSLVRGSEWALEELFLLEGVDQWD
ncbi:hypothetical protein [Mechercharimyces sp. CAU 1602]|uniref:hypothetical protein n=1 Tax=Mechercharimyces sp. CAU 1602 TaxID=2973933 RepID=UPI00216190A1|nr:hypothetical protein [Mechercharimyces sp. CAU 1602]MCS1351180.1 hypothetical protein [Mechercharimyces sp. CAU 1602]